uniref:Putative secreted protein n=1 Tax=Anopheles darlingi TaxID=43151 RepID=A0A2M4DIY2_ANODA
MIFLCISLHISFVLFLLASSNVFGRGEFIERKRHMHGQPSTGGSSGGSLLSQIQRAWPQIGLPFPSYERDFRPVHASSKCATQKCRLP